MFNIKENCNGLKTKFIQQYSIITEEDLKCNNGIEKQEMLERIQRKLGKTREELHEMIFKLSVSASH